MKIKMLSLITVFLMGTVVIFAQNKTEKFKVKGNCGMCETRIEKAAKSVDGVSKADWNKETKMVTIAFNQEKTSLDNVHKAIAKAGHDTKKHKAPDEVYDKLPGCCKYDRSESKEDKDKKKEMDMDKDMDMEGHEGHQHD